MSEAWDGKTERRRRDPYQQELLVKLDLLSTDVRKVVRFIEGNGNPERGAIVRIDRLEQAKASHDKRSTWMWGSIGGLALKHIWDFLTKPR